MINFITKVLLSAVLILGLSLPSWAFKIGDTLDSLDQEFRNNSKGYPELNITPVSRDYYNWYNLKYLPYIRYWNSFINLHDWGYRKITAHSFAVCSDKSFKSILVSQTYYGGWVNFELLKPILNQWVNGELTEECISKAITLLEDSETFKIETENYYIYLTKLKEELSLNDLQKGDYRSYLIINKKYAPLDFNEFNRGYLIYLANIGEIKPPGLIYKGIPPKK